MQFTRVVSTVEDMEIWNASGDEYSRQDHGVRRGGKRHGAKGASPNPQWTECEMQCIDEWIASQGGKLDRSEAIRRLVELGLKAKK
jgi:hypothetical protein